MYSDQVISMVYFHHSAKLNQRLLGNHNSGKIFAHKNPVTRTEIG